MGHWRQRQQRQRVVGTIETCARALTLSPKSPVPYPSLPFIPPLPLPLFVSSIRSLPPLPSPGLPPPSPPSPPSSCMAGCSESKPSPWRACSVHAASARAIAAQAPASPSRAVACHMWATGRYREGLVSTQCRAHPCTLACACLRHRCTQGIRHVPYCRGLPVCVNPPLVQSLSHFVPAQCR